MRMIEVDSDRELSKVELSKIQGIFKESHCPNESLINSIEGCAGFDGHRVLIGEGGTFVAHVEI